MIIVFTGPPLAGKGTQAQLLSKQLSLPLISIGTLLRENEGKGYEQYAMQGKNLPTELKFGLLSEKMDQCLDGFILENFPATKDDLMALVDYLEKHSLKIDVVFHITISEEEMKKRMVSRGRIDDTDEIVMKRRKLQTLDREPVVDYFRELGILTEVSGDGSIEEVQEKIQEVISR